MSYILDALRKSDQMRRRSGAPSLLQIPPDTAAAKPPAIGWYALVAVLLLGLGIAIGWWQPWRNDAPPAHPPVASSAQNAVAPPAPHVSPGARSEEGRPRAQEAVPVLPAGTRPSPSAAPAASAQATRPQQDSASRVPSEPPKQAQPATPVLPASPAVVAPQASVAGAPPAAAAPAPAGTNPAPVTPMKLSDLPLGVQQELPPMTITVHAYSTAPRDRLVGINGRLLHEGDLAAPGLKLEQITLDGMVFSYKGYTFRRGVN